MTRQVWLTACAKFWLPVKMPSRCRQVDYAVLASTIDCAGAARIASHRLLEGAAIEASS